MEYIVLFLCGMLLSAIIYKIVIGFINKKRNQKIKRRSRQSNIDYLLDQIHNERKIIEALSNNRYNGMYIEVGPSMHSILPKTADKILEQNPNLIKEIIELYEHRVQIAIISLKDELKKLNIDIDTKE